jgi:hypothetical protein
MTKLTGFAADIRPLFTDRDIHGMSKAFATPRFHGGG